MKYIDAEKLLAVLERQNVDKKVIEPLIRIIEQQMPDSTQLIAEWEREKAVLEQYNAFLDGFVKGLGYEGTK